MALQIKTSFNGIVVNGAYARIDSISGFKGGIDFSLNFYVSQSEFTDGNGYFKQKMHHFVPSVEDDAPNFIKQGYEYLKTLNEFENAIDVLE
jgi:hypothetical protein